MASIFAQMAAALLLAPAIRLVAQLYRAQEAERRRLLKLEICTFCGRNPASDEDERCFDCLIESYSAP